MSNSNLLRIADVAERLRVSASKVYELVAKRKIAHRRIDGAIRFEEADVREYLQSTKHGRKSAESWPARTNPRQGQKINRSKTWF